MKKLFDQTSYKTSKLIARSYSTSFSLGIYLLNTSIRQHVYAIYGFVRLADEIVDSFEGYQQEELLTEFIADYQKALSRKISVNPVLNAFQEVVHQYELYALVDSFIESMKMDLNIKQYNDFKNYQDYIFGSAEVVGLMCLKIFVDNDDMEYKKLKPYAIKLGSAFQKINFLRDIQDDLQRLGRSYFPEVDKDLTAESKVRILEEIKEEFDEAFLGIKKLPRNARFGVYIAYKYYLNLFEKLNKKSHEEIMVSRTRVSNLNKLVILQKCSIRYYFNLL